MTNNQKPAVWFEDAQGIKHYGYEMTNPGGSVSFVPAFSPANSEALVVEWAKSEIKAQYENAKIIMEEESRKRIEDHKYELREKQLRGMEERKERYKYQQLHIMEDSEGQLFLVRSFADNQSELSLGLLNVRHLKLTRLHADNILDPLEQITYDGCTKNIILSGDQCTEKGFASALKRAGIVIQISRELTSKVVELIYGHLKTNASESKLYAHFGWNKTESGWHFVDDLKQTYEGVRHN